MLENITQSYTGADASSEIAIMLFGAFVLGALLGWMLRPSGNTQKNVDQIIKTPLVKSIEDDLQIIEGVGPAIDKLLKKHGVESFRDVVEADVSGLEEILEAGGSRFKAHVPTTWPDQAKLADKGKWSELEEYQEILNSGK